MPRLSKSELVGMKDQDLAPLVARSLERGKKMLSQRRQAATRQRAERAASMLAHGPRRASAVLLSPALLRELLADASSPLIVFRMDEVNLPFRRSRLWQVARVVFGKEDLRCWVDPRGLHIRWNGERGGLNLVADRMPPKPVQTLTVDLRPAREPIEAPTQVVATSRPRPCTARRKPRPSLVDFFCLL